MTPIYVPGGRFERIVLWAGAITIAVTVLWSLREITRIQGTAEQARRAHLQVVVDGPMPAWLPGDSLYRERVWAEVRHAYAERGSHLLWISGGTPSSAAYGLVAELARAPIDGLDADAYGEPAIRMALAAPHAGPFTLSLADAHRQAELDVRLTTSFVRFVRERHDGRLPASALDPDWIVRRDTLDIGGALERVLRESRSDSFDDGLLRSDSAYTQLKTALRTYRKIAARGGWPTIAAGAPPRVGEEDPRSHALRCRLALTGDLPDSSGGTLFDAALAAGVRRFQMRHGIDASGRLDERTRAALNVPATERLRTLELNLERVRWLPSATAGPSLQINIPDAMLRLVHEGEEALAMRVVVGSPATPTPVFSDTLAALEFSPHWGVPKTIMVQELLPSFRRNPGYFRSKQMRVMATAAATPYEVEPDSVPWERVEEEAFPYFIRQDPGPENPLGQFKFICPNEYDVFLHDTSSRGLFAATNRFLSHGCVRLADPMSLAAYVLKGTRLASADSLGAIVAGSARRFVGIKSPLAVNVEYSTAWVDGDGDVQFRPDIYALDHRLDVALRHGNTSSFEINPDVRRTQPPAAGAAKKAFRRRPDWVTKSEPGAAVE